MKNPGVQLLPPAREDKLIVETMADETLVYDLRRHRAHYLNPAAALVWRCCRERRSVAETAALLRAELGVAEADPLVWMALTRLERARLLAESPVLPGPRTRYSRRRVVRALGLGGAAALLVPLVDSIVSPVAAQSGSCITAAQCRALNPPACTGQPICRTGPGPQRCCRRILLLFCSDRPC
jgi:hypothetical protein